MTEKSWMFALLKMLVNVADSEAPCKIHAFNEQMKARFYQIHIKSLIKIKLKSMVNFNVHKE